MNDFERITEALSGGELAVVRTDTLYGIIALADNETAVEDVFEAKGRDRTKPCIVLVADATDVPEFGHIVAQVSADHDKPTSVIVPATIQPEWLLRGGDSIAYRVVRDPFLKSVIEAVGPVIAPSANPEGLPPASTIEQAIDYFGDEVGCYVDGGTVPENIQASQILQIFSDGTTQVIRSS